MERIKQAIENAKNPGASHAGNSLHVDSQYVKASHTAHAPRRIRWNNVKNVSAFVMLLFAGWLWMHLNFLNRIELMASEYINDGVKQARAEVKKRQEDEAKFRQLILANLEHCQEAAESDKDNYMKLAQDAGRVKNDNAGFKKHEQFYIPKAAVIEATRLLEAAKNECQQIYDTQLKNGK
jgi:hypothetical protein